MLRHVTRADVYVHTQAYFKKSFSHKRTHKHNASHMLILHSNHLLSGLASAAA